MMSHHIRELTAQMVTEEEEVLEKMETSITENLQRIKMLNIELGNSQYIYNGPTTVQHKNNILAQHTRKLKSMKEERMVELYDLKQVEKLLCEKLSQVSGKHNIFSYCRLCQ